MSITLWDIKEAAFSCDVKDVEELILTNKGAADVGALSQATALRSLSLAFNALTSLSGLAPLQRLQSLNVSHNQLASLKGLQSLTGLATLNASHNKVSSLVPLSALCALTDLWLQNNAVAAPAELRALGALPGLQRLAIGNNPIVKALSPDTLRLVALRLCPALKVIDGRGVEEAEREACAALDLDALLDQGPPAASLAGSRSGGSSCKLPLIRTASASGSVAGSARLGGEAGPRGQGLPTRGSAPRTGAGSLPGLNPRRKARSASDSAYSPEKGAFGSLVLPAHHQLASAGSGTGSLNGSFTSKGGGGGGAGGAAAMSDDEVLAAARAALEAANALSSSIGAAAAAGGVAAGRGLVRTNSGLGTGSSGRRPPRGPAPSRPATQLQGTQFQAVLDSLPRFDPAKLPAKYGPPRTAAARAAAAAAAAAARAPPADSQVVEYEAKYPTGRGVRAVLVRRDGSAAAFWPGSEMAVTVDADYAAGTVAAAGGPGLGAADGEEGPGGSSSSNAAAADGEAGGATASYRAVPLYRMMVMYRSGGVAVSWESGGGGFVQYPSGGLMLMYSAAGGGGTGTCYTPKGEITRKWKDEPSPSAPEPPSPRTPTAATPSSYPTTAPPTHIDAQLDPCLGVRYIPSSRTLEVYLSCDGFRYRLRCGRNDPGDTWDPPPSSGTTGRTAGGTGTASPYESEPPTPGGTGLRPPTLGEERSGGSVGVSGRDGGDLPPPSFLSNLARQGGAGTHKGLAAGAGRQAGAAAGGRGAKGAGGGGGGAAAAAAADEGPGFSSIAASLQALTDGLQAMLSRDRSKPLASPGGAGLGEDGGGGGPGPPSEPPSPGAAPVTLAAPPGKAPAAVPAAAAAAAATTAAAGSSAAAEAEACGGAGGARPSSSKAAAAGAGGGGGGSGAAAGASANGGTAAAAGPGEGTGEGTGGGGSEGAGAGEAASAPAAGSGIEPEVAAHLAAVRKMAADSLAAAMAAASAAAAIGALSAPQ